MSVTIVRSFKFNQKNIQNQGGWCAGISVYLIKKLHERGGASVAPDEALKAAAIGCNVINCGFLAARLGYTTGSDVVVRNWIRQKQTQVDTALFKGTVFGNRYVYSHTDRGLALMTIQVSDTMLDRAHGGMFESWLDFLSSDGNHAGVLLWTGSQVFVFDPNCGGAIANFDGCSVIEAVDHVLDLLYHMYDRLNGGRTGRVVSTNAITTEYLA